MRSFKQLSAEILAAIEINGVWNSRLWKKHKHLRNELHQMQVPGFYTIDEKIRAIRDRLTVRPTCVVCGGDVKLSQDGFRRTCSVKCAANDPQTKHKIKKTLNTRYSAHHTQNIEWSEAAVAKKKRAGSYQKGLKTLNERYGAPSIFALEAVKEKIAQTNLERRGVRNPQQCEDVRLKGRQTNKERYGRECVLPVFFGDENRMKDPAVIFQSRVTKMAKRDWGRFTDKQFTYLAILGDNYSYTCTHCGEHHVHVPLGHKCECIKRSMEADIAAEIKKLGVRIKRNDRTILGNRLELDIVLPDHKLAIELNGVYWHGEKILRTRTVDVKKYHSMKYQLAHNAGYTLLQFTDIDWTQNRSLVLSMIASKINKCKRIYARSCELKEVQGQVAREFLSRCHIQGPINGKHFGLYHENALVALGTFGRNRFGKGHEILRLCFEHNTNIIGGASKIIKHAVKVLGITELTSYADMRFGSGNVYKALGFTQVGISNPGYWYIDPHKNKLWSRQKFQKHKLKKLLDDFDETKSEWENMIANGYDRIWDCGHKKFVLILNET